MAKSIPGTGYFKGIGPERGNDVPARDAYLYACCQCLDGTEEEQREFWRILEEADDAEEFGGTLVDWFFSGNWVYVGEEDEYEFAI